MTIFFNTQTLEFNTGKITRKNKNKGTWTLMGCNAKWINDYLISLEWDFIGNPEFILFIKPEKEQTCLFFGTLEMVLNIIDDLEAYINSNTQSSDVINDQEVGDVEKLFKDMDWDLFDSLKNNIDYYIKACSLN